MEIIRERVATDYSLIWVDREHHEWPLPAMATSHIQNVIRNVWNQGVPEAYRVGSRQRVLIPRENTRDLLVRLLADFSHRKDLSTEATQWIRHMRKNMEHYDATLHTSVGRAGRQDQATKGALHGSPDE